MQCSTAPSMHHLQGLLLAPQIPATSRAPNEHRNQIIQCHFTPLSLNPFCKAWAACSCLLLLFRHQGLSPTLSLEHLLSSQAGSCLPTDLIANNIFFPRSFQSQVCAFCSPSFCFLSLFVASSFLLSSCAVHSTSPILFPSARFLPSPPPCFVSKTHSSLCLLPLVSVLADVCLELSWPPPAINSKLLSAIKHSNLKLNVCFGQKTFFITFFFFFLLAFVLRTARILIFRTAEVGHRAVPKQCHTLNADQPKQYSTSFSLKSWVSGVSRAPARHSGFVSERAIAVQCTFPSPVCSQGYGFSPYSRAAPLLFPLQLNVTHHYTLLQ